MKFKNKSRRISLRKSDMEMESNYISLKCNWMQMKIKSLVNMKVSGIETENMAKVDAGMLYL